MDLYSEFQKFHLLSAVILYALLRVQGTKKNP